jgi:hypothetical protein
VVVCKKSPGLVPPSATATGIAIVPVLVTVTVRTVVLVEPTVRLPKLKLPVFPETLKLGPRVPVNDAVCVDEPVAGTFRVALFAPAVPVGVKVTEIEHVALGASADAHPLPPPGMTNMVALVPVIVGDPGVSGSVPVLVTVAVSVAEAPASRLRNASGDGVIVKLPPPTPDSCALCVAVPPATASVPVFAPLVVGVNVSETAQTSDGFNTRLNVQPLLAPATALNPAPLVAPLMLNAPTVIWRVPLFRTVTVCAALVEFSTWLPKFAVVGVTS